MSKPDLADVLAAVNALRAEHGIGEPLTELPKVDTGARSYRPSRCCVIALALNGTCGIETATPRGHSRIDLPRVIRQFTAHFDNDEYPELIA